MKYKFSVATGIIAGICLIMLAMTSSCNLPCDPRIQTVVFTVFLFFVGLAAIGGAVEAFMRSLGKV